ncbi:MAG: DUF3301 domain-containing protein [Gammaproteobacteria bacterium]
MFTPEAVVLALCLALAVIWWRSSTIAREQVLAAVRRILSEQHVQLLDQTVTLQRIRPRRRSDGRMGLRWTYRFDFSTEGYDRHSGWAVWEDRRITYVELTLPGGVRVIEGGRALH